MKTVMTLSEFKRYCEERQPEKIIYSTVNNAIVHSDNSLCFSVSFDNVLVSTAPMMENVYLISDRGQLHFNCVQRIEVHNRDGIPWDYVKICCSCGGHHKTYHLLMDY